VLAANAILNAGTEAQKSSLLPDLASGKRLATLAVTELNGDWNPLKIELTATRAADGYRLDGIKSYVVDGHIADLLVVAGRVTTNAGDNAVALFTLGAESNGVERRLLESWIPPQAGAHRFSRRACRLTRNTGGRREAAHPYARPGSYRARQRNDGWRAAMLDSAWTMRRCEFSSGEK